MRIVISWTCFIVLMLLAGPAGAQTKLPTADEVKALQAKYRAEHDHLVKTGIAKHYLPAILAKGEELAKKSDAALAAGRFLQASEAIRQARWQLPYQPTSLPDHISRIIGNLRLAGTAVRSMPSPTALMERQARQPPAATLPSRSGTSAMGTKS